MLDDGYAIAILVTVSTDGRVEHQKLNQKGAVWLSFWCSTRFTRKKRVHSSGSYLYIFIMFSVANKITICILKSNKNRIFNRGIGYYLLR